MTVRVALSDPGPSDAAGLQEGLELAGAARVAELPERLRLDLPDALAGDLEALATPPEIPASAFEVAIKVLPADRLADEARRARFEKEARAAATFHHPNIVTIYEIESAEGVDFIVMELVAGKTLDAPIPRHGMRLDEVLRIAIPLADALAAAHGAGIVHRDLKPANVMVTPEGVVKVLDFGLAKLTQGKEASGEGATTLDARARVSRPGTVAGTPAYMSPEQASGGPVDARSDIFSFGALLYEMVTGRRPFGRRLERRDAGGSAEGATQAAE